MLALHNLTEPSYLYQLAGKHRYASALMAARLEAQTRAVAAHSGGRLAVVLRESLVRYPEIFEREEPLLMVAENRQ